MRTRELVNTDAAGRLAVAIAEALEARGELSAEEVDDIAARTLAVRSGAGAD